MTPELKSEKLERLKLAYRKLCELHAAEPAGDAQLQARTAAGQLTEAVGIARSLLQAGVLERLDEPEPNGRRYALTVDLPPDFAEQHDHYAHGAPKR